MGNPISFFEPETCKVFVQLRIRTMAVCDVWVKMLRNQALGELQRVYCARNNLDRGTVEFLYKGQRVDADQTPDELRMEAVDYLEVKPLHEVEQASELLLIA